MPNIASKRDSIFALRGATLPVVLMMGLCGAAMGAARGVGAPLDLSGVWMPDNRLDAQHAKAWPPASMPFTSEGAATFRKFDPRKSDSTRYCMPLGTPRNTLSAAPRAVEILQTDKQLTLLFDGLNDLRRIYLDGRARPEDPLPTWMGHSVGRFENNALHVETVGMNHESILDASGLPHSERLIVRERFHVKMKDGQKTLIDEITLIDPDVYTAPLTTIRYFRWAPHAVMSEGSSLCQLDLWRQTLERYGKDAAAQSQSRTLSSTPTTAPSTGESR